MYKNLLIVSCLFLASCASLPQIGYHSARSAAFQGNPEAIQKYMSFYSNLNSDTKLPFILDQLELNTAYPIDYHLALELSMKNDPIMTIDLVKDLNAARQNKALIKKIGITQ